MPLLFVLRKLWSMLDRRKKAQFVPLVVLLMIGGLSEMGAMLVIFGYIRGLSAKGGTPNGPVAKAVEILFGHETMKNDYALVGGALVLVYFMFKNTFNNLVQFIMTRFLMKLNLEVAVKLLDGLMLQPYEKLLAMGLGKAKRQVGEIFNVFSNCFSSTAQVLADSFTLVMVLVVLARTDPWLTLACAFAFGGVGSAVYWLMQQLLRKMKARQEESYQEVSSQLDLAIGGLVFSRLVDARQYLVRRYRVAAGKNTVIRRRGSVLKKIPRASNELLLVGLVVGAVAYLTLRGAGLEEALPTLGLFGFAGMRTTGFMTRVNLNMQKLARQQARFGELYKFASRIAPEAMLKGDLKDHYLRTEQDSPLEKSKAFQRKLSVEHVDFSYPKTNKKILQDVELTIDQGSFVGICGESGGGKSTLLLLLMGLVKPSKGRVTCDDKDIHRQIRAWHSKIGYVSQDLLLLDISVRENVAFAVPRKQVDDDKVWASLEMASAAEFVRSLPNGLDTKIRPNSLSGGQQQRLVIARALYRDPEIIVFDEATAALDNITEREITESVRSLSGRKTIICVAHRLSTLVGCDNIFLMAQGRVLASGTYQDLLRNSPEFAKLAQRVEEPQVRAQPRETPADEIDDDEELNDLI